MWRFQLLHVYIIQLRFLFWITQATKKRHVWWFAAGKNSQLVGPSSRSRFVRSKSWTFAMLWWFLVVSPPPWRSSLARMRSLGHKWWEMKGEELKNSWKYSWDLSSNMESRVNISNWFVSSSMKRYEEFWMPLVVFTILIQYKYITGVSSQSDFLMVHDNGASSQHPECFFEVYVTAPGLCAWRLDIYNMFVPVFWLFSKKDGKEKQIFRMRFVGYESFWKNWDGYGCYGSQNEHHETSNIIYIIPSIDLQFVIFEYFWKVLALMVRSENPAPQAPQVLWLRYGPSSQNHGSSIVWTRIRHVLI